MTKPLRDPMSIPAILNRVKANEATEEDAKELRRLLYPSNRVRLERAAEYLIERSDVVRDWLPYDMRRNLAWILMHDEGPAWHI